MKIAETFAFSTSLAISLAANGLSLPPVVERLIEAYETTSEGALPLEIWKYVYNEETVFYLPLSRTHCCDMLSVLYDAEGAVICRPDGGFSGEGDGTCPDFRSARSEGVLVWRGGEYRQSRDTSAE